MHPDFSVCLVYAWQRLVKAWVVRVVGLVDHADRPCAELLLSADVAKDTLHFSTTV